MTSASNTRSISRTRSLTSVKSSAKKERDILEASAPSQNENGDEEVDFPAISRARAVFEARLREREREFASATTKAFRNAIEFKYQPKYNGKRNFHRNPSLESALGKTVEAEIRRVFNKDKYKSPCFAPKGLAEEIQALTIEELEVLQG